MDEASAFLSAAGRRLLFATRGRGFPDPTKLWIRALAESGTGRPLRVPGIVDEWTPDGRWVLSTQFEGTGRRVTWATDLEADTSVSLTAAGADMTQGQVSPNGRWVAYSSTDEGGRRTRVFVQGFPGAGARQLVSAGAANQPRWSRDGRELFFRTRDDTLMAVNVTERDEDLRLSEARPFFTLRLAPPNTAGIGISAQYDTLPNGHFLVNLAVTREKTSFHVLTNWQAC